MNSQHALRTLALKLNVSGTAEPLDEQKLYKDSYGFVKIQVYAPLTQNTQSPLCSVFRTSIDRLGYKQHSNHNHNLMYVGQYTLDDGKAYLLFENYLPKEFTETAGELAITINYCDTMPLTDNQGNTLYDRNGVARRVVTDVLVSNQYKTTVYEGGYNSAPVELPISSAEAAEFNNILGRVDVVESIVEDQDTIIEELTAGYYSAKALQEWTSSRVYGLNEVVYYPDTPEGYGVFVKSLTPYNTTEPFTNGELNADKWKIESTAPRGEQGPQGKNGPQGSAGIYHCDVDNASVGVRIGDLSDTRFTPVPKYYEEPIGKYCISANGILCRISRQSTGDEYTDYAITGIYDLNGKKGERGDDGLDLSVMHGTYYNPNEPPEDITGLLPLPDFADTEEGEAYVVDDAEIKGRYDLYYHGKGGTSWDIKDNWGGVPGPEGKKGDIGLPSLVYNSRSVIGSEPEIGTSTSFYGDNFNRAPSVGETFICVAYPSVRPDDEDEIWICLFRVTTLGELYIGAELRHYANIKGPKGNVGPAPLVFKRVMSIEGSIGYAGYKGMSGNTDFNRTPELGDIFTIHFTETTYNRIGVATCEITEIINDYNVGWTVRSSCYVGTLYDENGNLSTGKPIYSDNCVRLEDLASLLLGGELLAPITTENGVDLTIESGDALQINLKIS